MNVQELIELLEDVEDQTAEVRLAHHQRATGHTGWTEVT